MLKFSQDRQRYLQWLYQAKKRYGLSILNYMVTSNHVHLLVADTGKRDVIPIDYERLQGLCEAGTYDELKSSHRGWIEEYLGDERKGRQGEWTGSIAVGSKAFIKKVKSLSGFKAKGRNIVKGDEGYHLREEAGPYMETQTEGGPK